MNAVKNILFIHQSSELYGSDKVLMYLVDGLDKARFHPIVLVPDNGPLKERLLEKDIEVHVAPVLKISRSTLSIIGLANLFKQTIYAMRRITELVNGRHIDVVHSNTIAVLSGALWAKFNKVKHVWHVHEIITHPKIAANLFPQLLNFFATVVICNSNATKNHLLSFKPALKAKTKVIWNGMNDFSSSEPAFLNGKERKDFRVSLGVGDADVLVLLMGRINGWKGQQLLLDSAEIIEKANVPNIKYLVVGSAPPGQDHFLTDLKERAEASVVKDIFYINEYVDNIWPVWLSSDICAIPSTEPEPFGMVALEAMVAGKPVIAANHGGLVDIVTGDTGILFEPSDSSALAQAILNLVTDKERRELLGSNGYKRFKSFFTLDTYVHEFEQVYNSI